MADLPSLVKYANNPKIASDLSDGFPHPFTEEDGKHFLNLFLNEESGLVLCIEVVDLGHVLCLSGKEKGENGVQH